MKKIFVYANYSDQILDKKGELKAIGGAEVQLAFWSKALGDIAKVYSYTYAIKRLFKRKKEWGIRFCFVPFIPKVNVLLFYLKPLWLLFVRPDFVIMKSASQEFNLILKIKKIVGFKIVYLLASDRDVELEDTNPYKRINEAIRKSDYVVAQNKYQEAKAKERLNVSNIIQLGNIWDKTIFRDLSYNKQYDYVWVAKFNKNKRPEWFVEMAKANPKKSFAMVGASMKGYEDLLEEIKGINNLKYFGFKSLYDTTEIVSQSACLVCTSGYEGYPNTFLQAFSYNIPVLSTVNPSDIVTKYHLGFLYKTVEDGINYIQDDSIRQISQHDIQSYFIHNHDPQALRNRLKYFIQI